MVGLPGRFGSRKLKSEPPTLPCSRAGGGARPAPVTGTRERHEGSHRSEGSARLGKTGGYRERGRHGRRPGADGPGEQVHRGLGTPRRRPGIGRRRSPVRPWRYRHGRPRHPISRSCRVAIAMTTDRARRSCRPRRPADGGGSGRANCRVRATTMATAPPRGRCGPRAGSRRVCSCSSARPVSSRPDAGRSRAPAVHPDSHAPERTGRRKPS